MDYTEWEIGVALAQIVAAGVVGLQLVFLTLEARKNRIQQRKLTTLDYLSLHFAENQSFYHWVKTVPDERWQTPTSFDQKERRRIIDYLTLTERMAAGVRHKIIDIEFILDTHGKGFRRNFLVVYQVFSK